MTRDYANGNDRRPLVTGLMAALCSAAAPGLQAQPANEPGTAQPTEQAQAEIEEIVVRSTRRSGMKISEMTRSVSVITEAELDIQSALDRDAGSILAQKVPGFSPSTEALSNFGQQLRGRNFQTLIDGVPQNTPLRNGQRSLQSVDIDAVERIEVIRGGTAIYGFGADGGLINYITKRPDEGELTISGRTGLSFSTNHFEDSIEWNAHGQIAGRAGKTDFLVSGTFVRRNNTFDGEGRRRVVDPMGAQGGLDESDEFNVLAKTGYQIDSDQRVEASFNYFRLKQDADFGRRSSSTAELFTPPTEPEVALRGDSQKADPGNESANVNLTYRNADILGSALELQTFYQAIDTTFTLLPPFAQTEIQSDKWGTRATVNTPVDWEVAPFDITWGIDFLSDETQQFEIEGPDDAIGDQDAIAGFGQVEVPVGDLGVVTAGVRHEAVSVDISNVQPTGEVSGSKTLFNVSASAFLTESLTLFGGFSQSFSPGDILRVVTDGTFATTEEVELEFKETDNFELGLRGEGGIWNAELVGFFSESNNGTSFDADLNILTQPEEIWGLEASFRLRPLERLELGGSFSYTDSQVDVDNDGAFEEELPTTRIPPEKITGFVDYRLREGWRLRGRVIYSGTQSNDSSAFGGGSEIADYAVFDLFTSAELGPGRAEIGVTNLFDNSYLPVVNQAFDFQFANVRAPGRRVSLTYKLAY